MMVETIDTASTPHRHPHKRAGSLRNRSPGVDGVDGVDVLAPGHVRACAGVCACVESDLSTPSTPNDVFANDFKPLRGCRCLNLSTPYRHHRHLEIQLSMKKGEKHPTEAEEQAELGRRLDSAGLVWFAIPNGGSRHVLEARNLKRQGVKTGVPDLVILSPSVGAPRGVALELKRAPPVGRLEDVRPEQWAWLARFEAAGFLAVVGLGWRDSVKQLQRLGYEVQG